MMHAVPPAANRATVRHPKHRSGESGRSGELASHLFLSWECSSPEGFSPEDARLVQASALEHLRLRLSTRTLGYRHASQPTPLKNHTTAISPDRHRLHDVPAAA